MSAFSLGLWGFATIVSLRLLYGIFYRLYLSPVAKFPGPKLAALTYWYEFYYDGICGGQYVWEIEKMHDQLGPVVRINPGEINIRTTDTAFLSQLYPVGKRVDKSAWYAGTFGASDHTFATTDHFMHRNRRAAFGKFFSKASIRRLESVIQRVIDKLCDKLSVALDKGEVVNAEGIYSALTQDVITEYCFADCRNQLDNDEYERNFREIQEGSQSSPYVKMFPFLLPFFESIPDWVVGWLSPGILQFRQQIEAHAVSINKIKRGDIKANPDHPTIFHALMEEKSLPSSEKSVKRLTDEAVSLVGAGTATSSQLLAVITFHVLDNKDILQRLLEELNGHADTDWQSLEKLPYLTAIIHEGLRINYGTLNRVSRIHPDSTLQFENWTIPPGSSVAVSAVALHNDHKVFPEPRKFRPERWLVDKATHDAMYKHLHDFGFGSRQCAGMNLAHAELYLTLASVFRRFGDKIELFDTIRERDVDQCRDFFVPLAKPESNGIRITAKQQTIPGTVGWTLELAQ